MKGFLKIIFFLIIVFAVAVPFGAGFMIENHYNDMIARLNKAYEGDIVFTGSFQRGFMSSTAVTEIVSPKGTPVETLQHIVRHGPVIFNFNGWLSSSTYVPQGYGLARVDTKLNGSLAKKLANIYAGKPAYTIDTMVAFNGDSATNFINNSLTTQVGLGILKWQGANGTVNIDKDVTRVSGSMLMPSLEYSEQVQSGADTETLQITNFKVDFNKLVADASDTLNLSMDAFKIINKTSEELVLNNATLMFNKKLVSNTEGAELKTAFLKLKIASHDIGPFSFGVKTNNINSAALMAIMQDRAAMAAMGNNDMQTNIPSDQVVAMLSTKPTLDADMKLTMPEGNIDYVGHIEAGGANIVSADPAVIIPTIKMSQKFQIGSKIVIKILTRFIEDQVLRNEKQYFVNNKTSTITNPWTMTPEQLKSMTTKMINEIITVLKTKQYIIELEDVMSTQVEFANSVLTINGVQRNQEDMNQLRMLMEVKPPVTSTVEPVTSPSTTINTAPVTEAGPLSNTAPVTAPAATQTPAVGATPTPPVTESSSAMEKTPQL
jgi:uncharacterized protein YdgA (DUF945 family)